MIDVVARHDHLGAGGQLDRSHRHVGGAEVELGTVVVEEEGVTTASSLLST